MALYKCCIIIIIIKCNTGHGSQKMTHSACQLWYGHKYPQSTLLIDRWTKEPHADPRYRLAICVRQSPWPLHPSALAAPSVLRLGYQLYSWHKILAALYFADVSLFSFFLTTLSQSSENHTVWLSPQWNLCYRAYRFLLSVPWNKWGPEKTKFSQFFVPSRRQLAL